MTASTALINLAKLGIPVATLRHQGRILKKKKVGVKNIIGSGVGAIVGAKFTKTAFSI